MSDPYCREVIDCAAKAGVFTVAWDLTTEIGVPVYGCAILEPDSSRLMGIHYGFDADLAPEIALSRALTKAVQTRLTYISGSQYDIFRHEIQRNRDPDLIAAIWEEVTSTPSTIRFDARSSLSCASFEDDVRCLLDEFCAVGVNQMVVVDLHRPRSRAAGGSGCRARARRAGRTPTGAARAAKNGRGCRPAGGATVREAPFVSRSACRSMRPGESWTRSTCRRR